MNDGGWLGRRRGAWRIGIRAFLVAVPINFVWEMAQMGAFTGLPADAFWATLVCAQASLGDGLLVLLIWGAGALVFSRAAWVGSSGWQGWALLLGLALALAIGVEVVFVHGLGKWGYRESMPILPLVHVGLQPVLQMPLLTPPILWWATRPPRVHP